MNNSKGIQLLSELSTDVNIETFIEDIRQTQLPPAVNDFSEQYNKEGIGDRNIFIWKWLYNVFKYFEIDVVPAEKSEEARTIKTLLAMFITIIDDVAEEDQDKATLEQIRAIPTSVIPKKSISKVSQPTVSIELEIWETIIEKLSQTPRFDELKNLFVYNSCQAMNSAYYSLIVNELIYEEG